MALGFQDCCNSSSYFYLDGIPATVSQNEFYHIITLEGPAFCATYTTIPALNYLPPTYTLIEMTEYASCDTCFLGAPLTCPTQETIFLSQFGPGSISVGTDCSIRTLFPMIVECISTNPTFDGFADGVVRLFVTGGTPPYSFFNLTDNTVFGGALPVVNSTYTLIDGALEGEYPIQVVDAQADYNITVNCVLESPPTELTVLRTTSSVSIVDACDGTIVVAISNGTPPYQIFINGIPTTETTITELCAGDYDITVIDSGVGTDQQISSGIVTVGEPNAIIYPNEICLRFVYCQTTFNLTFTRQGNYNFRANYVCDNPEDLGLTQLILRWEAGWTTTSETTNGSINFSGPCPPLPSLIVQFVKTSPNTEQPVGTWQSNLGLFQGETASLSQGVCVGNPGGGGGPAAPILTFTTTNVQCGAALPLGQVVLVGSGGSGGPYQYYVSSTLQSSSTLQLSPGTYVAYVVDSIGTQSGNITFVIGTDPIPDITMSITTTVDIPNVATDGPVDFGAGIDGVYTTSQPVSITVDLNGIPAGFSISGYFKIKEKRQGVFNDYFIENLFSAGEITANGFFFNGSSISVGNPTLILNTTSPRTSGINTNFLPANQSSACPAAPVTTYFQRTVIRETTIGSVGSPLTITNTDTITFDYFVGHIFRPQQNNGCQPGLASQFDIQFIRTSPNIPCYNFKVNGVNYDGITPVVASIRQIGDAFFPSNVYGTTVYING